MPKIIFKRLTVKEEERIIAGDNSSNDIIISISDRIGCYSVPVASVNTCDDPIHWGRIKIRGLK